MGDSSLTPLMMVIGIAVGKVSIGQSIACQ